jgi:hypothetical protein
MEVSMKRFVFLAFSAALIVTGVSAFAEKMDPGANIMTTVDKALFSYHSPAAPDVKMASKVIGRSPNEENPQTVINTLQQAATLPTSMADNSAATGGVNGPRS